VTRALLLDRDGTLIVDVGYPRDPERVELLPGCAEALRELQQSFALVIVSNQSGIGRGLIQPDEAVAVQARVIERFAAEGVRFAGAYLCPHAPEEDCECRKPAPGLLLQAARELGLELPRSVMIGDKHADVQAGWRAECGAAVRFGPGCADREEAVAASSPPGVRNAACADWPAVRRFVASFLEAGY
jgi:D-glycero-D-manno-heptose 1,7-bisphosphate phosphatase